MTGKAPRHRASHRGLSLLELLVAFSIMAMSLALLYRSMGGSARSAADMALQQQAVMVAESVLSLRESVGPDGWQQQGTSAGFLWQVTSQPYVQEGASGVPVPLPGAPAILPLHHIVVNVQWEGGQRRQQLEVQTLLPQRKPLPGEAVK